MKKLLVAVLSIVVPVLLYADVVELTTGEKLEGKIIQKDESGVTLKVHYGLIIIEKKFIKSITTDESKEADKKSGDDKKAGDQDKKAKLEARKLKTRVERWVKSRNRLICKKCGGDGKSKCKYCKGTGLQYSDPVNKTTRG
jgi:hypothetical protein